MYEQPFRYRVYDDSCNPEFVSYYKDLEDAKEFARLNACACVDELTGHMYCDYREDGEEQ